MIRNTQDDENQAALFGYYSMQENAVPAIHHHI